MIDSTPIPFVLGMFTVSGSPAFPAIVLDDEAAISIEAIATLAARLGLALTGKESLFGLLQNWDHNFRALCATVAALDDAEAGKYFRSAFTAIEFLTPVAPLETPRQVLCEVTNAGEKPGLFVNKLASTVVGPKAKIHLPSRDGKVVGEVKVGAVIAHPSYELDPAQAVNAIAGYMTVTDLSLIDGTESVDWLKAKSQPAFLPTGPYFVPAAFADAIDAVDTNIAFNGETNLKANLASRSETIAATVARLTHDFHLFPGDLVCCGTDSGPVLSDRPALGDGDIIEAAVRGLGQQTLNAMRTSLEASRKG
ncbi:fumarylacetoacetate hydrolase family protein [Rhizobium alvei]|uniref:Fumarylacetoacetate hydrolase family protein n=1 Tax=Rhizobium alvei TaxID=1132659 RepID=A0ABT8YRY0_9HYPH|nr:fumarylacetoacetate hydrolase family protein [Rhizobium alvei]MDO6966374.1 fumarylacetoacetate hydrolase family protein [Rhizobium alvei]